MIGGRGSAAPVAAGACFVVGLLLSGCGLVGDAPTSGEELGRDSAGVRIVDNGMAVGWPEGRTPTVRVDLEIGAAGGTGPDVFGNVVALAVDSVGAIHVLDQQAARVVVFDAEGRHRGTLGAPGAGPGELSPGATAVLVAPDGVVTVPDMGNARVTRFAGDGSATSWPLRLEHGIPVRWDDLADGTLVAQLRAVSPSGGDLADPIVRYGTAGSVVDTLTSLPGGASVTVGDGGLPSISLFAPEPLWDVAPDGDLAWAMNSDYDIRRHAPDGSLTSVVRRDVDSRSVSQRDRAVLTEMVRDLMLDQGVPAAAVQEISARMRIADRFPALAAVHLDGDGGVWVQRVAIPTDAGEDAVVDPMDLGSADWDVFDDAGRWRGTVRLPERFTMMAIRGDALYGVVRDDLDVQRVVRLRLER